MKSSGWTLWNVWLKVVMQLCSLRQAVWRGEKVSTCLRGWWCVQCRCALSSCSAAACSVAVPGVWCVVPGVQCPVWGAWYMACGVRSWQWREVSGCRRGCWGTLHLSLSFSCPAVWGSRLHPAPLGLCDTGTMVPYEDFDAWPVGSRYGY